MASSVIAWMLLSTCTVTLCPARPFRSVIGDCGITSTPMNRGVSVVPSATRLIGRSPLSWPSSIDASLAKTTSTSPVFSAG